MINRSMMTSMTATAWFGKSSLKERAQVVWQIENTIFLVNVIGAQTPSVCRWFAPSAIDPMNRVFSKSVPDFDSMI
ncbi:MAG: hypothetical protein M0C28_18510 [Candidatus Moduliflexus flocculans]|nr:hypothetical protein [Candidatus Moduliflexus flocculans]